jgi:hypothetical protein
MALSDSPPGPSSFPRTVKLRTPPAGVSLSAPRSPLAHMPCPLPRTIPAERAGASAGCFPIRAAFPVAQAGRRPRFFFGHLGARPAQPYRAFGARSGARYGAGYGGRSVRVTARQLARPAFPGLCHEASARPVTRPSRSSASMLTDNYMRGLLPPTGCPRRKGALRNAAEHQYHSLRAFEPAAVQPRSGAGS